jgi:hypothetical protein
MQQNFHKGAQMFSNLYVIFGVVFFAYAVTVFFIGVPKNEARVLKGRNDDARY